jgi:hypothetical protein
MSAAKLDRQRLARVLGPAGPEVSCEECFESLDRYVELQLDGADADVEVPGLGEHLEGCPACREDHDSLLDYLRPAAGRGA